MSVASVVGQVIYKRKSSVYMPALMSNKGDLYQEYDGDYQNPSNIAPDFGTLQPMLSYVITSSRVAEGIIVPSSVKWFFNGTEIKFGSNRISTETFAGLFEYIPYSAGVQNYYALKIKDNLVKAAGAAPCSIKAEATITIGNTSDKIQFVYNIPITYGVGNSKRVTIMAGDNKNFTIRTKGDTAGVKLKAVARVGSDEITSGLAYKWFKLSKGAWVELPTTSQILTVKEADVDGASQFKVEVSQNGSLIGMDVQTVIDATEPFDIILNANPDSETITDPGDTVTYTPILVKRGSTTKFKDMNFYFVFTDCSGVILNTDTSKTPRASATCTYGMCDQAGGNVAYTITTEE